MDDETVPSKAGHSPTRSKHGIGASFRRIKRFNRGVGSLHVRKYRQLTGYRFYYLILSLPLLALAGALEGQFLGFWGLAIITWLSLAWRVPRSIDGPADGPPRSKPWWPRYPWPITLGLILSMALMAILLVLDIEASDFTMELGFLIEAVGVAFILSLIYYFLFAYLAGLLRVAVFWNLRFKKFVITPNFYLVLVLLPLAILLGGNFENMVEWWMSAFALGLPLLFFRSPWSGKTGSAFRVIIAHMQLIFAATFILALLTQYFSNFTLVVAVLLVEAPQWISLGLIDDENSAFVATTLFLITLIGFISLRRDLVVQGDQSEAAALSIHFLLATHGRRHPNHSALLAET